MGLVMWIVAFFGTGLVLLVHIVRASVTSIALTASVAGAFTAYVVQGMVSIDMVPLLATGWLMAGLALACAREPLPTVEAGKTPAPKTRKAKAASVSRSPQKFDGPSTPAWVPIAGGVLALAVAILVGTQIAHVNQIQSVSSQQVMQQLPPEVGVPATLQATDLDRRCSPMINFAYDSLVQAGDLRAVAPTA